MCEPTPLEPQNAETEIQTYLQVIISQDGLLQSYRALFLGIEAAFFAFAFFISKNGNVLTAVFAAFLGIIFCFLWIIVTSHRAWIIDQLKSDLKILKGEKRGTITGWLKLAYGEESIEFFKNPEALTSKTSNLKKLSHNLRHLLRNVWDVNTDKKLLEKSLPRFSFNLFFPGILLFLWTLILFGLAIKRLL